MSKYEELKDQYAMKTGVAETLKNLVHIRGGGVIQSTNIHPRVFWATGKLKTRRVGDTPAGTIKADLKLQAAIEVFEDAVVNLAGALASSAKNDKENLDAIEKLLENK
jgi:hypothetical protein